MNEFLARPITLHHQVSTQLQGRAPLLLGRPGLLLCLDRLGHQLRLVGRQSWISLEGHRSLLRTGGHSDTHQPHSLYTKGDSLDLVCSPDS